MKKKNFIILLFFIIILIRIIGIGFNLPIVGAVPDENYYENVILNAFNNRTLNLHFYWYPSFFFYLNLILSFVFVFIAKFAFIFLKLQKAFESFFNNNQFYIMRLFIRFISALTGTLAVYFSYKIAKKIFKKDHLVYLTLLLIGFNSQFIIFSHIGKPDMLQTLFVQISIYFSLIFYDRKHFKFFYISIFFSAMAAGSKLLGGMVVIVPMMFLLAVVDIKKDWQLIIKHTFSAFILAVSTFLFTTPFIIFEFSKAKSVFLFYKNLSHERHYAYLYHNIFSRFFDIQKTLFTYPIFIGLIIAFFIFPYLFFKEKKIKQNILYLFFIIYFIIGLFLNFLDARYYFSIVPTAIIIFIIVFDFIFNTMKKKALIVILWSVLIFLPLYKGLLTVYVFTSETTQEKSFGFLNSLPQKITYAFEIMTGANHSPQGKGAFSLGKRTSQFYFNSMITFALHNKHMYQMYFSYDKKGKYNPFIFYNYNWIFRNTVIMKKVRGIEIDFLNPPIDYLKFVDTRPIFNSKIKIKAYFHNKSNYHLWLMSGNKILIIIPPHRAMKISEEFKVMFPKAKALFLFAYLKNIRAKGKTSFRLSAELVNNRVCYKKTMKGTVFPNKPIILYLEEEKNE